MMSSENIRTALGLLQDDAEYEDAWLELQDALTSPGIGMSTEELVDLLAAARREHESRREWAAVANLLEYEISLIGGTHQEAVRQADLARVLEDELLDDVRATAAYKRLLEFRPDDPTATEAIERNEDLRSRWRSIADSKIADAQSVEDKSVRSSMLSWAAEVMFRFGKNDVEADELIGLLKQAMSLDTRNRRAALLLERLYRDRRSWEDVCTVLETLATESSLRDERFAAWVRLARVVVRKLQSPSRGVAAYERALDLVPGYPEAMNFLSGFFGSNEQWDHLVALYEDQLRSGAFSHGQELGICLQIAMVHWRMRQRPDQAEPYFDRVRRVEPAHPGMLDFYREFCKDSGDANRLMTILTDAQRSLPEGEQKLELAAEIAKLAESHEDVHKAIEQYKGLLRQDPANDFAREALKRLYRQTDAWPSLVDVLRHELDRIGSDDPQRRLGALRDIADIYRQHIRSDAALVGVIGQILQIDSKDIDSVRELCRVYESLQRWRDLLVHQQKLAELTDDRDEKLTLLRSAAKRWLDQFQNVQNATEVYEKLVEVDPSDQEARGKLRDLYTRRRAWPQLYALLEKEVEFVPDDQRVELYLEMAKLAAERIDRSADAIRLYKKVLDLRPNAPGLMDQLERQAERDKDFETVAEVLERRIAEASDENARIAFLQKLGPVYTDRLNDPKRAAGAWRRILEVRPNHSRAMRVLRDSYLQAEDFDAISELYAQNNDWEGLAEVLSSSADRATDPTAKIELSFRAAAVYEQRLNAPERAFRAYERVLSARPDDTRAAAALVPIYEKEERWSRLPVLYEILLSKSEDDSEQLTLLRKLAEVTGRRLSDKAAALAYARRAYDLAPRAENALGLLEGYARAAGAWQPFVEAIEARLAREESMPATERRSLQVRLAEVYAQELGKLDEGILAYRQLVQADPSDQEAVAVLDRILRNAGRTDDLRWLFDIRIAQATPQAAVRMLTEWATLEEDAFGEAARAIALYRRALETDPADQHALVNLPRLLIAGGDAAGAAEIIQAHRDQSQGDERAALELTLAQLHVDRLGRFDDALLASQRALALGADADGVIAVLDKLLGNEDTRSQAAELLVDVHARQGNPRREADALAVLVDATQEPSKRLELVQRLIDVYQLKLEKPAAALDVVLMAVTEFREQLSLWDRASELAVAAGRAVDLAKAYEQALSGELRLDDELEVELSYRAARLCREQIGDQDAAVPYLERMLARQPANDEAFRDLKEILMARERWQDLESLYAKAIMGTTDSGRRVEFLAEVALICEDIIEDSSKAIDYHERILDIEPMHQAALGALEKLYASERKYEKLVRLLERRLGRSTEAELVQIKLRLGQLHLDHLNDPSSALPHLEDVLRINPNDHDARRAVERILEVPALRSRAAEVLEAVYETRDETRDLVRVLDIRLESTSDEAERRNLLRRIAMLRDERLADDAGALEALAKLIPLDPIDASARSRMVEIGRRINAQERCADVLAQAAATAPSADVRGAILMEVASIYRDQLGDPGRAEAVYRRVLEIDPSDAHLVLPAARALEEIYSGQGNHAALVETLRTEVRLEDERDRRAEIYGRLGEICESILGDLQGAIEAWRARLQDNPSDMASLGALERLYEKTESWRALVEILRTRQENADGELERKRLMIRTAEILTHKLEDTNEAISAWQSINEEFGYERPVLQELEVLYQKAERWVELADTLETHLSLVDEPSERIALLVRLGDVRRERHDDLASALESYRQALTIEPSHAPSRAALERLLDLEAARREAAQILHPLYEADGDHQGLLRVVEIEAATTIVPDERLEMLQQAVRVAEGPLGDASRAFEFAVRGLREAAAGDDVRTWLDTVERLTSSTRRFPELVVLLREVVDQILDGEVQLDVTLRIADLARSELGDRDLAREYYTRALDLRGDEPRALVALESLYEEAGNAQALLDIIRKRVECAATEEERKRLLFRQARLCSDVLQDRDAAISVYETILDIDLDPASIDALEKLYADAERPNDLVQLYERQLEKNPPGQADLRVKIARVAHKKLSDTARAFEELADALAQDSEHAGAIAELENLLVAAEDPEHRARAGEMLEPFYLGRADWRAVKKTIEARLSSSQDPDQRRELLRRLALMQEEQEEDFAAALETTAKLLHEDITDEDTWKQLESQARVASAERRLAEIYAAELDQTPGEEPAVVQLSRRTGELFAQLGNTDRALTYYRRALNAEPESIELFDAVDSLLLKANRPEERVQLYRTALDHRFEPVQRIKLLHTIAELERTSLGQPDQAIETYRSALDVEERDAVALDALTELYRERERFTDLAELYLRRAEMEEGADESSAYRLSLARLYRDQMKDIDAAMDQYEEIVRRLPSHRAAVADLEALMDLEEHKGRIVETLLPLYEGADDWRKLIQLNAQRFELTSDELERVNILRDTAKLWEDRGGDARRAFDALRVAFEIEPADAEIRGEMERLAEQLGAWDDLAAAYEAGLEDADPSTKRELLAAVASIHDKRRDDPRLALQAYERLHHLDETDPEPLENMDLLAMLLADWETVVRVLTKKAELIGGDEERAVAWRRVAETKRDMLDDRQGAIQAFERALELDPLSSATIDCLIELYEHAEDSTRLVELYQRRVELTGDEQPDLKYDMLVKTAERYDQQLGERSAAIDALRQALEVRPADHAVLRRLETLLRKEQMWPDLLDNLRQQAAIAEDAEERVALRREIGKLLAKELSEPAEALEAFRMVLDDAPRDEQAIAVVQSVGDSFEELRLEAAAILEPVLRSTGQYDKLVPVLEMRLRALSEPAERASALRAMSDVLDVQLSKPSEALDASLRALSETPEDVDMHRDIERLAASVDGWKRYADALEEQAAKVFDATVGRDLWTRLGRVAEDKLGDDKRAVSAYAAALEQAGDAPELLEALDRLHTKLGNAEKLAEILDRRVSIEMDPAAQAELFTRLAVLQIDSFHDKVRGLETLRMALERAPEHQNACDALEKLTEDREMFEEAATALEAVYRARVDYQRLASLFEKRISHADNASDRLRMRLDLARVLEEQASDPVRAQKILVDALADDPADAEVLSKLEELATTNSRWSDAARGLEAALETSEGIDPMTMRDLYARLSDWYRARLSDHQSAETAMRKALERDQDNIDLVRGLEDLQREPGRERDLIATLRRRAVLELDVDKKRELFREAKTLAETVVQDNEFTEQVLRQLIELDDTYLWAYEELTRLREQVQDWQQVVALLLKRAELTASGPDSLALKHQAAEVLRTKLENAPRALEIYEEIFDAEPMDTRAAQALRELYASLDRHKDLSDLLARLIDIAMTAEERTKLRLELAQLYAARFDAVGEAVSVLLRVLEEEPGQTEAVVALSQLYEKSGRDQDLADLLNSQIELARSRADASAELTFQVRLGEVYESRLGDPARAIETYEQVLQREPTHRGALESLGRLFEAKGELARAAETLERLHAQVSGDEAIAMALRLADIFGKVSDDAGTRRALERGLEVRRDAAEVRERLRKLYESTGAWAEVADLIAEDADGAPETATKIKLLQQVADIHQNKRNDAAAAASALENASAMAPEDRELLLALCDAYSASGRGKDAVAALEKIVESYGGKRVKDLATIHHRLAKAYVSQGENEKGLSELDQAFRINPGNLSILVDLGRLALDMSELERAQKTFRALLLQRLDATAPISKAEVFFYLGEISHRQGDKPRAIQMLERAVENDAGLSKAKDLLAQLRQ